MHVSQRALSCAFIVSAALIGISAVATAPSTQAAPPPAVPNSVLQQLAVRLPEVSRTTLNTVSRQSGGARVSMSLGTAGLTTLRAAAPPVEGSYVKHANDIFRIVGGAPLYISTWANVGGAPSTAVPSISDTDFAALRAWPSDGTFARAYSTGAIYRFAGGAPIYVSNWAQFYQTTAPTNVDVAVIINAGAVDPLYRYVKNRTQDYNLAQYDPAQGKLNLDGTLFIRGISSGRIYKMVDGAPIWLSAWAALPSYPNKTVVDVDDAAISNAGGPGNLRFLRKRMDDGWAIRDNSTGQIFLTAGGAPVYVDTLALLSGTGVTITPSNVDGDTIAAGGGTAPQDNLLAVPRDGTYLSSWGQFADDPALQVLGSYQVTAGVPVPVDYVPDGAQPAVVDQKAIDQAGPTSPWNHLKPAS